MQKRNNESYRVPKVDKIFSKRRCKERENDRGPKEGKYREEEKFKVRMRE